ncbi:MAG TPA: SdrD B-like domain-containing protein, partial [Saprospiraceae bacterium]|nr:SdrD B-like domain-containing protein [Saprospiraceae bacterium]
MTITAKYVNNYIFKVNTFWLFPLLFFSKNLFGQVSGTVFRDYNGDGIKSVNEPLLPGVTVRVYNTSNQLCGSAITNNLANPNYSINGCGTGPVRVEFVVPDGGNCVTSKY